MKNAQWFALAAGCLVVGLVGGGYLGVRFAQSLAAAEQTLALGQAVQGLEAARTSGNDAAYEEAMRQHIAFLQLNERSAQPLLGEKAFALDLALAYARLSILAGKRGADVESSRLLQKAASFCPAIGWPECSAQRIFAFASQVDSNLSKHPGSGK